MGNQISADITAYRVSQASDFLTALNGGVPYPAGEINPHSFADIVLSAVQGSGTALQFASDELLLDRQVVMAASGATQDDQRLL